MGEEILEFSADKYYNAGKVEGKAEGRAEGKAEVLSALVNEGFLSVSEAAKRMSMTESEFLKLCGQYTAH